MHEVDARVAIVMITYNRADQVERTLGELARLPERPKTVVVDNGSTDGTADRIAARFPEVELIRSQTNKGAAGRSLGVRRVEAPYVAFADDDTWWEPGSLRRAADLFDAHPRLGLVTARVLVGPENIDDPICAVLARSPLPREPAMPGPPLLGFLAGASVIRRSAFLEAGGFGESVFIGGEEELLAVDMASNGWWLCYVPELVVHHHPSPVRNAGARRSASVRNAIWFAWQRRPWRSAVRRTLRMARGLHVDRAAARGFVTALAGLPRVLRTRRVVSPEVERQLRLLECSN